MTSLKTRWQRNSELKKLLLPILLTQFCQSAYGLIDTLMASRYGSFDLAAISLGAGMWLPVFFFLLGVVIATTPVLGKLIGESKHKAVPHHTQQSLYVALILGVLFALVLYCLPLGFGWLDAAANLKEATASYLRAVAFGFPALALYTSLRCYAETLGKPLPVTLISLICVLANIPLNYVFMYGKLGFEPMGGVGCGVATALVMWLNLILLSGYLAASKHFERFRFYKNFSKPTPKDMIALAALGFPIGVSIFFEASLFSVAAVVLAPFGETTLAAHQVALSVTSQLFMLPLSVALSITILSSRLFGEQNSAGFATLKSDSFYFVTLVSLITSVLLFTLNYPLARAYTSDPAVVELAATLLVLAGMYQLVDAWQVTAAGLLRGLHDTTSVMWLTFVSYWLVGLSLGVFLSRVLNLGAVGFWSSIVVGLTLSAGLLWLRLKHTQVRAFAHSNPVPN